MFTKKITNDPYHDRTCTILGMKNVSLKLQRRLKQQRAMRKTCRKRDEQMWVQKEVNRYQEIEITVKTKRETIRRNRAKLI